jgi:hypothetical protein
MNVGDEVHIPSINREGEITQDLGDGRYRVGLYTGAGSVPTPSDKAEDDEAAGLFASADLEPR